MSRPIKSCSIRTDDDNSLSNLTVVELKEVCRAYGLAVSGNKDALLQRLLPFIDGLNNYEDGDEVSFEEEGR